MLHCPGLLRELEDADSFENLLLLAGREAVDVDERTVHPLQRGENAGEVVCTA